MGVVVVIVVVRQELRRSDEARAAHASAIGNATTVTRTLILVTADVEREAVFASIRERIDVEPATDQTGSRTIYTLGPLGGTMVLLAQAPEQGTASAAGMLVTAQTVIAEQRPDFVILVGICYGLRPSEGQRIGDIVVARRVQNVDHRKVTERDGAPFTINRGVNVGTSPGLLDRLQAGQSTWDAGRARVHIGTVLTSNTLANSRAFVEQLRAEFPDAIAGEMEATAVHEAATLSNKPDWIMVKAISDWGYGKTDADQVVAARNAADYVTHVLAGGALAQRRPAADRNV
jgi:nucleoside phosphorylase